jgi:hypothetical protein
VSRAAASSACSGGESTSKKRDMERADSGRALPQPLRLLQE